MSVLQENDKCQPATVINKCIVLHSYIVKLYGNGKQIRHNRKHLQDLYRPQIMATFNKPEKGMRQNDLPPSQKNTSYTENIDNPSTAQHVQPRQLQIQSSQIQEVPTSADQPTRRKTSLKKIKDFIMYK